MGSNSRNITRIDSDKPRLLFERETHAALEEKPEAPFADQSHHRGR